MNILIADDHHLILEGFKGMLCEAYPYATIDQAQNVDELFAKFNAQTVDILFQDVRFGAADARFFLHQLTRIQPSCRVIMISMDYQVELVETFLSMGVWGYVSKSEPVEELLKAISSVAHEKKFLSPLVQRELEGKSFDLNRTSELHLTPREKEVLLKIADGLTSKEIAKLLNVSIKTVEIHRSSLLEKFEVSNVAKLIKEAFLKGKL